MDQHLLGPLRRYHPSDQQLNSREGFIKPFSVVMPNVQYPTSVIPLKFTCGSKVGVEFCPRGKLRDYPHRMINQHSASVAHTATSLGFYSRTVDISVHRLGIQALRSAQRTSTEVRPSKWKLCSWFHGSDISMIGATRTVLVPPNAVERMSSHRRSLFNSHFHRVTSLFLERSSKSTSSYLSRSQPIVRQAS